MKPASCLDPRLRDMFVLARKVSGPIVIWRTSAAPAALGDPADLCGLQSKSGVRSRPGEAHHTIYILSARWGLRKWPLQLYYT